jgi:hypothetical protein
MRLKRKIPTFIFGVSIGLVAGVGFFIFKLNDIFANLKDVAKEQITVIEQPVKNVKEESDEKKKNKDRFKINVGNSGKVNYHEVDSLLRQDAELNVATDELLSVKNVKAIKIGSSPAQDTSAAAKLAGVDNNYSNLYFIEFWKTPLNSKGYRFTKNKVMLYGFVDYSNIQLYVLDNDYYIKSSDQVYKLVYGSDFSQLEKVVDNELLAKIN